MSLAYPNIPLRRGDVYMIKLPYTEDPTQQEMHPALVIRDERLEKPKAFLLSSPLEPQILIMITILLLFA